MASSMLTHDTWMHVGDIGSGKPVQHSATTYSLVDSVKGTAFVVPLGVGMAALRVDFQKKDSSRKGSCKFLVK